MLPAIIGAIGNLGAGALGLWGANTSASTSKKINEQNIAFQRETNEHNEALMREAWSRDDSYYTRLVSDLQNAGLNPAVASGMSAKQSDSISLKAPESSQAQAEIQARSFENLASSLMQMSQQFASNLQQERDYLLREKQVLANEKYTNAKAFNQDLQNERLYLGNKWDRVNDFYRLNSWYKLQNMTNEYNVLRNNSLISNNKVLLSGIQKDMMNMQLTLLENQAEIAKKKNDTFTYNLIMDSIKTITSSSADMAKAISLGADVFL